MDFFFKKIIDPEKAKADADAAAVEAAAAKKREQPQPNAESPAHMFMNFTQNIIPGAFGWGAKDTDVGANSDADANPNVNANANNGDSNSISNTNSSNATNTNKLDRTTIGLISPVPEVKRELNDVHGERKDFLSSFKQMDVESKSENQSAIDSKEDLMTFSEDATQIAPPVNSLSHSIDDQKEITRTGDLMTFNEDSTEPAKSLSASASVSANQNNEDLLAFIDNDHATTSMSTEPMHCSVSAKYKYQIYELLCWHSKQ